jgi:farnesyl-diphosphate farnesyltransferase
MDARLDSDWAFCDSSLNQVSRTFSQPIAMLGSGTLRRTTACAYLLCRIADTIEDDEHLLASERDCLYEAFLAHAHERLGSQEWRRAISRLTGSPAEIELSHGMDAVLRVLRAMPGPSQDACWRWIGEMCRGMSLYGHRPAGPDGLRVLMDLSDLHRYCYFVAGTVGHLLTDLFEIEGREALGAEARRVMRRNAEDFGVGLQLANILKDVGADRRRGWSFVPRSLGDAGAFDSAMTPRDLRAAAEAVDPVFQKAYDCLERGLEYTLAVPRELRPIRLFLLLPLWMAVRTLRCAQGNVAIFDPAERVAISRAEVAALIFDCVSHVDDDTILRSHYADLRLRTA